MVPQNTIEDVTVKELRLFISIRWKVQNGKRLVYSPSLKKMSTSWRSLGQGTLMTLKVRFRMSRLTSVFLFFLTDFHQTSCNRTLCRNIFKTTIPQLYRNIFWGILQSNKMGFVDRPILKFFLLQCVYLLNYSKYAYYLTIANMHHWCDSIKKPWLFACSTDFSVHFCFYLTF